MASSDFETPDLPKKADSAEGQDIAQQAADGLKGQIAALRDQVRQASLDLRAAARRKREPRSFNDKD